MPPSSSSLYEKGVETLENELAGCARCHAGSLLEDGGCARTLRLPTLPVASTCALPHHFPPNRCLLLVSRSPPSSSPISPLGRTMGTIDKIEAKLDHSKRTILIAAKIMEDDDMVARDRLAIAWSAIDDRAAELVKGLGAHRKEFEVSRRHVDRRHTPGRRARSDPRAGDGRDQDVDEEADYGVLQRLNGPTAYADARAPHLEESAEEGVRTLYLAYREILKSEWSAIYAHALTTVLSPPRSKASPRTAFQKRSHTLAIAWIKLWVLIGDFQQTAIYLSSHLINPRNEPDRLLPGLHFCDGGCELSAKTLLRVRAKRDGPAGGGLAGVVRRERS
ncbi:hypothetical protein BDK51DRAFT_41736 [Blyttiomyces helicus]|uniref:Uncharacterized protein n=1 Tax=Blyttiomyces helicus TaxID=388810 RepID=A0A4P9W574_9FUNG|nr:hypothetical protein BDK51DRAFT_41736 [Blyttiomyces helicus]|eukprot:RKO87539.1 hypothetical protein BDK51DRAFT_41736 [Blyttiomyces helicus]